MKSYNFSAGPAILAPEVKEKLSNLIKKFDKNEFSIAEISHRSSEFETFLNDTTQLFRKIAHIGDEFEILYLQGGASLQFHMIPMNFLSHHKNAVLINTGVWSQKALEGLQYFGTADVIDNKGNFTQLPNLDSLTTFTQADYGYFTDNNTIYGTEYRFVPNFAPNLPIICDMSSSILSKEMDYSKFDLIFAGAQKNLGIAGVTVVIIKKTLLEKVDKTVPAILNFATQSKNSSLYNTPPVFAIASVRATLEWIEAQGGIKKLEEHNIKKAELLYDFLDSSILYYNDNEKSFRSRMNVVFKLRDDSLTKKLIKYAEQNGMIGIAGHRNVGGLRASLYNMMPLEGVVTLIDILKQFEKENYGG
ncbi:MAG: 3-phosphoserine/phosphohydroxythreonine transaminase [Fusobacteria bacterium]|nr:3-phosphoserine/phosphohydroxythreonine transaminase [Fusobacteriota bacterium]